MITNWLFSKQRTHELTIAFLWLIITVWEYRDQSVKNWNLNQVHSWTDRPIRRESKTVCLPGSGFNAVDYGFQVLDSSLHQWNLESGIQLVGFQISWAVFRIPKPRSLHSTSEFLLNSSFHKLFAVGDVSRGGETSPAEQAKLIWDKKLWIHQLLVHISYPIKANKTALISYMHVVTKTMQSMFYWEWANNLIAVPNVVLLSCRTQLFPSTLALQQHDRATAV